eukprot:g71086.t1
MHWRATSFGAIRAKRQAAHTVTDKTTYAARQIWHVLRARRPGSPAKHVIFVASSTLGFDRSDILLLFVPLALTALNSHLALSFPYQYLNFFTHPYSYE